MVECFSHLWVLLAKRQLPDPDGLLVLGDRLLQVVLHMQRQRGNTLFSWNDGPPGGGYAHTFLLHVDIADALQTACHCWIGLTQHLLRNRRRLLEHGQCLNQLVLRTKTQSQAIWSRLVMITTSRLAAGYRHILTCM